MSFEHPGLGSMEQMRETARERARTVPAGLIAIGAALLAVLVIVGFVLLDYRFDQAPHRIIKVLLGVGLLGAIVARPLVGLWLFPVITPFLPWAPVVGIPGLNVLNVLILSIYGSFALVQIMKRQPFLRGGVLTFPIVALGILGAISVVRGAAIPTGFYYDAGLSGLILFRSMVTLFAYFVTRSMVRGRAARHQMAWALVAALVVESVVTIMYGRNGRGGRAVGSIGQSNELGTFLAMYAMVSAAMIPAVRNWFGRVVLLAGTVAGVSATMLSVSRAAILSLGVGLVYVAFRSSRALAALLLVVLAAAPLWVPDYVKERWDETTVSAENSDEETLDAAAQSRVDTWKAMTSIIMDHPLDGVGFAGLAYILPDTGDELGVDILSSSHNTYLRFLAEMGVLGLLVMVLIFWRCAVLGWRVAAKAEDPLDRQLGVALMAATMVMAVSCAFGDRFFPITVTGNFWILAAIVDDAAAERRSRAK